MQQITKYIFCYRNFALAVRSGLYRDGCRLRQIRANHIHRPENGHTLSITCDK